MNRNTGLLLLLAAGAALLIFSKKKPEEETPTETPPIIPVTNTEEDNTGNPLAPKTYIQGDNTQQVFYVKQ